ncbi:MAG: MFS transporter [Planctomycetaceae bacterium]
MATPGAVHGEFRSVTPAALANQALWTAGHALTSGAFLLFFARELGAAGTVIALLLVVPETAAVAGLAARPVIRRLGGRKRTWMLGTLASRAVALGIPLAAFPGMTGSDAGGLWLIVAFLALSQAVQGIAYVSFVSWLADLVPEGRWGRFFAVRNIAYVVTLMIVSLAAGAMRDWWTEVLPPRSGLYAYAIAFSLGTALQIVSLVPMVRFPEIALGRRAPRRASGQSPESEATSGRAASTSFALLWRNRSLRCLLIHNWWLAAANGLTQSAFFLFLTGPLGVGLAMYSALLIVMRLTMVPTSWIAGIVSDRRGNRGLLMWSVLAASSGLLCWLAATPDQWWWVIAAHVLWGAFAAANIAGRNLLLKLSPPDDTATSLALFRNVGGWIAGMSGLAGGLWLDALLSGTEPASGTDLESFRLLFAISFAGRATSVLWLLGVREPHDECS